MKQFQHILLSTTIEVNLYYKGLQSAQSSKGKTFTQSWISHVKLSRKETSEMKLSPKSPPMGSGAG